MKRTHLYLNISKMQRRPIRLITLGVALLIVQGPCAYHGFAQEKALDDPRPYVAHAVKLPPGQLSAADGSIYITGNDLVQPLIERLNELFVKTHPGFRFSLHMKSSAEAISGITSENCHWSIARDATFWDKDAFASIYGYQPTDVQIGWDNTPDADHYPPGKFPPAAWVNVATQYRRSISIRSHRSLPRDLPREISPAGAR